MSVPKSTEWLAWVSFIGGTLIGYVIALTSWLIIPTALMVAHSGLLRPWVAYTIAGVLALLVIASLDHPLWFGRGLAVVGGHFR